MNKLSQSKPLTVELLEQLKVCDDGLEFFKSFPKLHGKCINNLNIVGDYNSYVSSIIHWDTRKESDYCFYHSDGCIYDRRSPYINELKRNNKYWQENYFDRKANIEYWWFAGGNSTTSIYDDNGNVLVFYSGDYWQKNTYDDDDNETYSIDSEGYWSKHTYDANGNLIHSVDGPEDRSECHYHYGDEGYLIRSTEDEGEDYIEHVYRYDASGNEIFAECHRNYELLYTEFKEYDKNNVVVSYRHYLGNDLEYNYDSRNLPDDALCRVYHGETIVLEIRENA